MQRTPEPGHQNSLGLDVQPSIPTIENWVHRFLRGRGRSLNTRAWSIPSELGRGRGGDMNPVNTVLGVHLSTELSRHQEVKGNFQTRPFCHQPRVPTHCGQATGVDESQSHVGQTQGASSWDPWGPVLVSTGRPWERQHRLLTPVAGGVRPGREEARLSHEEFSEGLCPLPGQPG